MGIEVGALADWVTGLSTVGLAGVTMWGLRTQRQDIKRQQQELRDQQEQLNEQRELTRRQTELITRQLQVVKSDQARQVTAWVETVAWATSRDDPIHEDSYAVFVRNRAAQPIYDVTCTWLLETDENDGENLLETAFAGVTHVRANGVGSLVLPLHGRDGESFQTVELMRHSDIPLVFPFDLAAPTLARYVVTFTDAADVRWQLDEQDRLTEIPRRARVTAQRGAREGG